MRSRPNDSIPVLKNGSHIQVAGKIREYIGNELPTFPSDKLGHSTDPEAAISSCRERQNVVAFELGRVKAVENCKPHSVETSQSGLGSQPQITVLSLSRTSD